MEKPKTIAVPVETRKEIEALVSKFRDRQKSYDSGYQEESVRVQFINPFFKALGWDVENKASLPETLKPVVHIYSQRLARTTVRPDYAFRYGREKKFLLEAKKPAVDIFVEKKPAYQARIYSFNEKLPIAILTNFKQFAVYDYRITKERPSPEDKPEKGRREFFTFEQYLDNLEFLYSTFSYEAAKQLNFDLYVEEAPAKISREVDEDFLLNLESWRKTLALDIAKKNLRLSVRELNFAVQVTIDRIIFLRMAEDRGIERPNQLQSLINGTNVYPRLLQVFYRCDEKYNSGLFDFKDDQISTKLKVDDKVLAKIIDSLYGEDCPYLFSQWDADVLGSVYERFLGKVIHLTATHQARVEDKPEVKKAKGVYYTPKYIVEYIVENTLGKLLYVSDKSVRPPRIEEEKKQIYEGIPAFQVIARSKALSHIQIGGSTYFISFKSAIGPLPDQAKKQVLENIAYDDGKKYDLLLALAMDDHVHFIMAPREVRPGVFYDLSDIMKSIKGVSARRINQLLGKSGNVWQAEVYDKIIRDDEHLQKTVEYILNNPIKTGLVDDIAKYEFILYGKNQSPYSSRGPDSSKGPESSMGLGSSRGPNSSRGPDTPVGHNLSSRASDTLVRHSREFALSPKEVSNLKILDPACGSGSFLVQAYQHLLDYHLEWYARNDPEKNERDGKILRGPDGATLLTIKEKKNILLNNIFGVDIDPQAVEVTKLSLLLKVLEDEDQESISFQQKLWRERSLPDLDNNIKCGNSLIGRDFYKNQQMDMFNEEQKYKINAFDWEQEFKDIFHHRDTEDTEKKVTSSRGTDTLVSHKAGFDVVIGNPPYVRQETLGEQKQYFETHYQTYHGMADLYTYFIEKAINVLKPGGYFSFIVSNKWMRASYAVPLRAWLKKQRIISIVDFGDLPVFTGATTYPCILIMSKGKPLEQIKVCKAKELEPANLAGYIEQNCFEVSFSSLSQNSWSLSDAKSQNLLDKIKAKGIPLSEYVQGKIYRGILTGLNEAFVIDKATRNRLIKEDNNSAEIIKPFLTGRDIKRYQTPEAAKFLILFEKGWTLSRTTSKDAWNYLSRKYPGIARHLEPFKSKGEKRFDQGDFWWELRACDYYQQFEKPKINFPDISTKGNFAYDSSKCYTVNTSYIIPVDDLFLLGILNSSLTTFFYKSITSSIRGDYLRFIYQYVATIPIAQGTKISNDQMASLVKQIIDLNQKLSSSKTPDEKVRLEREIKATDGEIDRLVYELYGLTEEEIKFIESG